MAKPLKNKPIVAYIDQNWNLFDREIRATGPGQKQASMHEANAHADQIAQGPNTDAMVVRDNSGVLWVYPTTELGHNDKAVLDLDSEIRGKIELALPAGTTLQSFAASYRTKNSEEGYPERIFPKGRSHDFAKKRANVFMKSLRDAGIEGHQLRHLRKGVTLDTLTKIETHLQKKNEPAAARTLTQVQLSIKHLKDVDVKVMSFTHAANLGAVTLEPAQGPGVVSSEVIAQVEAGWILEIQRNQMLLDGAFFEGYRRWEFLENHIGWPEGWDIHKSVTERGRKLGKIRPHDVAQRMLRSLAAKWSVIKDIREGKLQFTDATSWVAQAPNWYAEAIHELAMDRLKNGPFDNETATHGMLSDPLTPKLTFLDLNTLEHGRQQLRPETINWIEQVFDGSRFFPDTNARLFGDQLDNRKTREKIESLVGKPSAQAEINIAVAYELFKEPTVAQQEKELREHRGFPSITSGALTTIAEATGVLPVEFYPASPNESVEDLERQKRQGKILGFWEIDAPTTELLNSNDDASAASETILIKITKERPVSEFCREILEKIDAGDFDHFEQWAIKELREMAGPPGNPGDRFKAAQNSMASRQAISQWVSQAGDLVAVTVVSYGAGAIVELGVVGLIAQGIGVPAWIGTMAPVVARYGAFSTVPQLIDGREITAQNTIEQLFVSFLMSRMNTILGAMTSRVPIALKPVVAISAPAAAATAVNSYLEGLSGNTLSWPEKGERFVANVGSFAVLALTHKAIWKINPVLVPGGVYKGTEGKLKKEFISNGLLLRQVNARIAKLESELARTQPGSVEHTNLNTRLSKLDARLVQIRSHANDVLARTLRFLDATNPRESAALHATVAKLAERFREGGHFEQGKSFALIAQRAAVPVENLNSKNPPPSANGKLKQSAGGGKIPAEGSSPLETKFFGLGKGFSTIIAKIADNESKLARTSPGTKEHAKLSRQLMNQKKEPIKFQKKVSELFSRVKESLDPSDPKKRDAVVAILDEFEMQFIEGGIINEKKFTALIKDGKVSPTVPGFQKAPKAQSASGFSKTLPAPPLEKYHFSLSGDNSINTGTALDLKEKTRPLLKEIVGKTQFDRFGFYRKFNKQFEKIRIQDPSIAPEDVFSSMDINSQRTACGTNCVGMARKLVTLLQENGIRGYTVAVNMSTRSRPYTHAAVLVRFKNGYLFLDPGIAMSEPVVVIRGEENEPWVRSEEETWTFLTQDTKNHGEVIKATKTKTKIQAKDGIETKTRSLSEYTILTNVLENPDESITKPGVALQKDSKSLIRDDAGKKMVSAIIDFRKGNRQIHLAWWKDGNKTETVRVKFFQRDELQRFFWGKNASKRLDQLSKRETRRLKILVGRLLYIIENIDSLDNLQAAFAQYKYINKE